MEWNYYKKNIITKDIIKRCDITPIFENPKVFNNLIKDLLKPFKKNQIDKIIAIDSLGFILGTAIARKTKKPLVLIRKKGKLPLKKEKLLSGDFTDYTKKKKGFEIKKDSIKRGDKILLVDEWVETGTQIKTAIKLIEKLGWIIIGISTIYIDINKNTKILIEKYKINSIKKS